MGGTRIALNVHIPYLLGKKEIIKIDDVFFSSCKWMETSIPKTWPKIVFFFQFEYLYS